MKKLSSISSNLKMNNQMSKYLPSLDGGHYERIFATSSYHHQIRMKSSSNGGESNGKKGRFEQRLVETLSNHSYQMLDSDFPPIESREDQNKNFAKEVADMRNVLKGLRKWEYTQFGRLVGESSDRRTIGDGTRFFVMNYNILSQQLLSSHRELYNDCDSRALDPNFRKQLLFTELNDIKPEIVCLQEVEEAEFYNVFEPTLFLKGYKGVYKKRTGDKSDGCAIFYKTSRFSFVDKLTVEYFQPHISLLNRDNVGLFVKLRAHNYSTGRFQDFVVGTTHILFNPKRQDIKLAQVQLLLAEMDRFAFNGFDPKGYSTYVPVIMTGDFNADPYSPLIRFMTDGVFRCNLPTGSESYRQQCLKQFIPPHSGISDQCQHYKLVLERIKQWLSQRRSHVRLSSTNNVAKLQPNLVNLHSSDAVPTTLDSDIPINNSTNALDDGAGPKNLHDETSRSKLSSRNVNISDDVDPNELISSNDSQTFTKSEIPSVGGKLQSSQAAHLITELNAEIHQNIIDEICNNGARCTFASGELSHELRLSSVYGPRLDREEGSQNAVTTKQFSWTTVDYIFYSKIWNEHYNKQTEGKLRLIRRLGLLTRNQCKEMGAIPNLATSSDHFSLVAEFVLK